MFYFLTWVVVTQVFSLFFFKLYICFTYFSICMSPNMFNERRKHELWSQADLCTPTLSLSLCNLGRTFNPSEPQFPHRSSESRGAQRLPLRVPKEARPGEASPGLGEAVPLTPHPRSQAP